MADVNDAGAGATGTEVTGEATGGFAMVGDEVGKLLTDKVSTISGKLAYLTLPHLDMLRELEAGGENRVTLLAAIDDEIAKRAAETGNGSDGGGAGGAIAGDDVSGAGPTDATVQSPDVPAEEDEHPKIYSQADVDQMIADLRDGHDREIAGLKADHAAEVARVKAKAPREKAKRAAHADPLIVPRNGPDPADLIGDGPAQVAFVDGDMVPLAGLTPLEFEDSAFETDATGGALLIAKVEFPREAPRGDLHAAVLLVAGKAAGIARMVMPFGVCGGQASEIPARSLRFVAA